MGTHALALVLLALDWERKAGNPWKLFFFGGGVGGWFLGGLLDSEGASLRVQQASRATGPPKRCAVFAAAKP